MIRSFQGKTPKIHPTAWVSEAAYVIGDVEIGEYSSVWPGTVIRGDTIKITLGAYVDIQDNCVVHADNDATYGDYVTLGHGVTCHALTIATHCLIGNGATVNDGVVLGEYSIVASGAVVLERKEYPAKSFVAGVAAEARDIAYVLIQPFGDPNAMKTWQDLSDGLDRLIERRLPPLAGC